MSEFDDVFGFVLSFKEGEEGVRNMGEWLGNGLLIMKVWVVKRFGELFGRLGKGVRIMSEDE